MTKKLHILEIYLLISFPIWMIFIPEPWFYEEAIPATGDEETDNLDMFIPFFRIHENQLTDTYR